MKKDGEHNLEQHKFIVRADFYGDIASNAKGSFWMPRSRGLLCFSRESIIYRELAAESDTLQIKFSRIIKMKMVSLNPKKNQWVYSYRGNPYYLLFWNPLWNRQMINITYLGSDGQPREMFFKLKTLKITIEAVDILKKLVALGV